MTTTTNTTTTVAAVATVGLFLLGLHSYLKKNNACMLSSAKAKEDNHDNSSPTSASASSPSRLKVLLPAAKIMDQLKRQQ